MTDFEIDGLELYIAFESITGLCLVTSIPTTVRERGLQPVLTSLPILNIFKMLETRSYKDKPF
jgi:hypothetical protein